MLPECPNTENDVAFFSTGEELRSAVEEWQTKHSSSVTATRLTTGFLDGTHPVVDAYELKAGPFSFLPRCFPSPEFMFLGISASLPIACML